MKPRTILVITWILISIISHGQQSTVIIDTPMTGTQNVVARDAIFLLPGFSYTASQGQSFNASINSQLEIPVYSTGDQIVNPNTRNLEYSLPVGTLPGSFDVNKFGAATYSIPFFTSPGTAGMQPSISIVYNSLLNDGLLGKGWDLAGISTIQRVPQNFYHEGQVIGVSLQNTDKFALDSNRLILTGGTYGADGSVYRTEIETFVKVTAHGTSGNGPAWFEVQTKDGKTLEYGNTSSSRVEAYGSSTVNLWRINRMKDQHDNYIDFYYIENNGESYIDEIKYTGNIATSLDPYNSIKFTFGTRTDVNGSYVGGCKVPKTKVLTSISLKTEGDELVREYQFRYIFDFYTHLNEIVEYGSDHKYLNSTAVWWGSTLNQFSSENSFYNNKQNIYYLGDFNGDGRTDFVVTERKTGYTSSDKWQLRLASADGITFTLKNEGFLDSSFKGFVVADADGNGNDDIFWRKLEIIPYDCNPHPCDEGLMQMTDSTEIMLSESNETNMVIDMLEPPPPDTCWDVCYTYNVKYLYYYNNGTTGLVRGSTDYDLIFNDSPIDISLMSADLDGDGKADYLALDAYKNLYEVRGVTISGYLPQFSYPSALKITDFDGDGRKDILITNSSEGKIYQYNPSSQQFSVIYSSSSYPTENDRIFPGDFNGDKKTDILSWNNGWTLKFSTGTGFETSSNIPALTNTDPGYSTADNNIYIRDFNGDKKDDILESYIEGSESKLKVYFSRGDGVCEADDNTYSKSSIEQDYFNFGDFNGDGKSDLFYNDYSSASNIVNICFFHKNEMKHLVSCIANGFNYKTRIYFDRLNSDASYYTKQSDAQFPLYDFNGAVYAVSSIEQSNGIATGLTTTVYTYEGFKIHKQGKGSLGFKKITSSDDVISFSTVKEYSTNPDYYFTYLSKTTVSKVAGPQVSETINSFSVVSYGNKRIFPYLTQIFSYDNLTDFYAITTYWYDTDGNQTKSFTEYRSNQETEAYNTIVNQYETYGNFGIKNKLIRSQSTSVYPGQTSYIRRIKYTYSSLGDLLTEIKDTISNNINYIVTKTYSQFNSYGLPEQITISAATLTSRTITYEYDSKKRFITKLTNPIGHYISKTYDPGTGNTQTETGIDNNTTSYHYDSFGRLSKTTSPQGIDINTTLNWDNTQTGGANSVWYSSAIHGSPGAPDAFVYYDQLGREVMTSKDGLTNVVNQKKEYNADGTLHRVSWPYVSGESNKWITYTYDDFGRTITENNDGSATTISYTLGSTTVINPASQSKTTEVSSAGKVIQITENNNNTIDYSYHSSGQVKTISTAGTTISSGYDALGRRSSITDPNLGTTYYTYNAFGELTKQKDSRDSIKPQYNTLGQMVSKISAEGTTNYTYNSSGNGIEQVNTITGPNGITQSYNYDSYGRVIQITENIPGDQSLTTSYGYDSWGNNTTITYPSGETFTNAYNTSGILSEITHAGSSIWKLDEINSAGQPIQYSLGNSGLKTNFEYDATGLVKEITTGSGRQSFVFNASTDNLSQRSFKITSEQDSVYETFTYDNMNRLQTSQVGQSTYTINYSTNGNITYKTDVGSYSYDNSKKNAIIGISDNPGTIISEDSLRYTSSNMTSYLEVDPYIVEFTYGPDDQRIKSVLKYNGNMQKTKYYSGSYEKDSTSSEVKEFHYISCPFGLVAVLIKEGETTNLYYTETDHLGSIIGLMNSNGTYLEQFSYDAWGRRRNPTDWTFNDVPQPALFERGFTGHEHLDKVGLINMNGRMYDPILGRFLGVDPVIQTKDNSQSFNGYTYCLNNPLKYIDPTGYSRSAIDWSLQYSSVDAVFYNNYVDYWGQIQDVFANMHTYEEAEKSKDKKDKDNKQKSEKNEPVVIEEVFVHLNSIFGLSGPTIGITMAKMPNGDLIVYWQFGNSTGADIPNIDFGRSFHYFKNSDFGFKDNVLEGKSTNYNFSFTVLGIALGGNSWPNDNNISFGRDYISVSKMWNIGFNDSWVGLTKNTTYQKYLFKVPQWLFGK